MALHQQASAPVAAIPTRLPVTTIKRSNRPTIRRTADYQPPIWSFEHIQSLKSEYLEESCTRCIDKLKLIEMLEGGEMDKDRPLHQLELIDALQRLGLSYHFESEVNRILQRVYSNYQGNYGPKRDNLYVAALELRLLRQHGYKIPQEIFNSFINERGNFKACLGMDCKEMLYLYEASFLSMEGESTLDVARTLALKYLSEYVKLKESKDPYLSTLVEHALEFPLHWRMPRMEARWFIDINEVQT